jgi:hypothetical protein
VAASPLGRSVRHAAGEATTSSAPIRQSPRDIIGPSIETITTDSRPMFVTSRLANGEGLMRVCVILSAAQGG